MTLAQDYVWTAARALGIAAGAVLMGAAVQRAIASCPKRLARLLWLVHLIPFLTPVLLVGYAWPRYAAPLTVRHPAWNQALYALLVWLKLTPVATLALHFAPSAMSPEALHCHRLLRVRSPAFRRSSAFSFWLHGRGRAIGIAFVVVFLLAFGEFEMATLMGIPSWTVTVFDAQYFGTMLGETLKMALPGLLIGLATLGFGLWLLFTSPTRGLRPSPARSATGRTARSLVGFYLLLALALVTLLPAYFVADGAVRGIALLPETLALAKEVLASALFGLAAAACAYLVAAAIAQREDCLKAGLQTRWFRVRSPAFRQSSWTAVGLCVPGLLGPLVLALVVLALFQLPWLRAAYDTPIPVVLALTLLLLPFALVLRTLVSAVRPGEASHAARLLTTSLESKHKRGGRRVLWHLEGQGRLAVAFLLFVWAYFDLTVSDILHPAQMTPVLSRLYNFMHYGHTPALSIMVLVCFSIPFLLWALVSVSFRVFRG
ncbi:MAG: hypothetical protein FJ290_25635 [Planctomycetes bacterium]|nr:hypothetical protein [Planctomycetota bacterium]